MGLIKAAFGSISSTFGDQNLEFVTCPQVEANVLVQRGEISHGSGNKNASDGVLSNGSVIAVPEGMAMMIIDNGAIKEFTAEAGDYKFDSSSESSIFAGGLGHGIVEGVKTIGKRIAFGGQTARDQRVYYVNLKKIAGNRFGSPQPKKITDDKYGMLEVTFFGEYVFQVTEPHTLVYTVLGANPKDTVIIEDVLGAQLKTKFVEQLTQAITIVMRKHHVPFGDMGMYGTDISEEMNTILDDTWRAQYGLEVVDVALGDINLTEESMTRVSKIDDAMIFSNASMQSGLMASATADAMKTAAGNENGAMMGFMGMGMAQGQGANMMGAINQNIPNSEPVVNQAPVGPEPGSIFGGAEKNPTNEAPVEEILDEQTNISPKFCSNCGQPASGKFCGNCGNQIA